MAVPSARLVLNGLSARICLIAPRLLFAVPLLAGCSGDALTLPAARDPARVVLHSGDRQSGPQGGLLRDPLVVRVINAMDQAVTQAAVLFEPEEGTVLPDTALSDQEGRASARWILGGSAGAQHARAYLAERPTAAFRSPPRRMPARKRSWPS